VLAVRSAHLEHLHAGTDQVTSQTGSVGARPFDPERLDAAKAAGPFEQPSVAIGIGGNLQFTELLPEMILGVGDVEVLVRVDADYDTGAEMVCHAGGRCLSS
jgi:hypothetical protein